MTCVEFADSVLLGGFGGRGVAFELTLIAKFERLVGLFVFKFTIKLFIPDCVKVEEAWSSLQLVDLL